MFKTLALVVISGAAGALLSEQADKHLSGPLGLDKAERAGTRAAVKVGYVAGGAVVAYGILSSML